MNLLVTGLNHQTAPVALREQVAFGSEHLPQALQALQQVDGVHECMILSTCNRTEIYCTFSDTPDPERLTHWLHEHFQLTPGTLSPYLYHYQDQAAVEHMMAVACGLNSLVLGEPQILGQLKDAYQTARQAGTLQQTLDLLLQQVFATAKRVRSETAIGQNPVSVAFAAVSLARQFFGELNDYTALLLGAGETIELVARHLKEAGIGHMIIANRTYEKAHTLAQQFSGYAIGLNELNDHLHDADLIITSTGAPHTLLHKPELEAALKKRRHRPIFAIDIAVPRDIEPVVSELSDVYLYTVDDLKALIDANKEKREAAAAEARELIRIHAEKVMARFRTMAQAAPLIRAFRARAEALKDDMLRQALHRLEQGHDPQQVVTQLANQLTHKLIHAPTVYLRKVGEAGDEHRLALSAELLGLKTEQKDDCHE